MYAAIKLAFYQIFQLTKWNRTKKKHKFVAKYGICTQLWNSGINYHRKDRHKHLWDQIDLYKRIMENESLEESTSSIISKKIELNGIEIVQKPLQKPALGFTDQEPSAHYRTSVL